MTSAAPGNAAAEAPRDRPTPPPLLRVRDLAVTHEGEDAATPASVTFEVAPGEVVLVLGPSGSGKSTLALTLNGLIPHAVPARLTGSVLVHGTDTTAASVASLARHVGMVFQDPDAQLITGTLRDDVAFGPENLLLPVDEVLGRTERALRQVGLWERRDENPDRLSGGGKQRLAIASALAMGSDLLVLDEPTANLDPAGIDDVYDALRTVVADGRSILLVEHNLDAAVQLTDRVVVLDADGRTVAVGGVDAVLRDRAEELHDLGVWLPVSTMAALSLQRVGWSFERMPLTPAELREALEAAEAPAGWAPRDGVPNAGGTGASGLDGAESAAFSLPSAQLTHETTAAPVIDVRGLTLQRGRRPVLHDVALQVGAGEFVAVVGANGAGKTSLVQAIAGVIPPPRGTVSVGGADPARTALRDLSRRIGFVFQNPEHQFISHTVFDELAHGLRGRGLPTDEVRARTMAMLERFGLAGKADVHPFLLSGGQKRRLSVGTALIGGAPILALDEPTFGQDRARADELLRLLRELNAAGTTVLVVTHDMQLVAEYARRTIVVGDGRIVADAATADVFADEALLRAQGLRLPPLRAALSGVTRHPRFATVTALSELAGADA
ncbi:energy-coupling factor transport system ATP-binding protein [Microbacterium marinum]|uniref:Energy-coupling factor transport system ATP-binding protein n=1 Tax=Microbacterium marinum TaxID=421115 RepID=A0A7W7BPM2_9MICO|nr:energy-coupling factor transport system ATP-binding protein [Microbacterium marinum]